jgi:hypothetical protein
MFYKNLELPNNDFEKDVFLLRNFLDKTPTLLDTIAYEFKQMTAEVFLDVHSLDIQRIVNSTFEKLRIARVDLGIDAVLDDKLTIEKLTNNGLTGESLYAKLISLDWLWEKAQKLFLNLRDGLNLDIFQTLLNQIKSILRSLLLALGIDSDIYDECIDLLLSFSVMSNTYYQEL